MTIDSKKIMSKNIQHYMDIKNKTRKDVCNALELNYATFSDWIQGRSYPRPDKVEKLAKYFGVTRSDLVDPHPTSTTTDTINTGTNNGTINSGTVNGDIINATSSDFVANPKICRMYQDLSSTSKEQINSLVKMLHNMERGK